MSKSVGTTNGIINWDSIVESIVPRTGDHNTVTSVVDRSESSAEGPLLDSYREIIKTWTDVNYDLEKIQWWDYYPGEHFDISVQDKFSKIVNAEPRRVFISEVMPGNMVPYHWDVEDKEEEWLANGDNIVRYLCFIHKPRHGQTLMLEDHCFYFDAQQHEIFKWDSYRSYHAGINAGYEPYYLFHFVGAQNV